MASHSRIAVVGFAAIGVSIVAFFLACSIGASIAAAFAILTLLFIALLARLLIDYVPRAGVVASIAVLGWAPLMTFATLWTVNQPIVTSHWRCGTGDMALVLAGIVLLGFALLVTLVLSSVLGRTRVADGSLRVLSYALVIVGAIGASRAIVRTGLDEKAWIDSLPIVATLPSDDDRGQLPVHIGNILIDGGCHVRFYDAQSSAVLAEYPESDRDCISIRVRHDAAHELFIVEEPAGGDAWVPVHAYDTRMLESIDITPSTVHDRLKPPLGWRIGAAAGMSLAILSLLVSAFLDRRARALRSGSSCKERTREMDGSKSERLRVTSRVRSRFRSGRSCSTRARKRLRRIVTMAVQSSSAFVVERSRICSTAPAMHARAHLPSR